MQIAALLHDYESYNIHLAFTALLCNKYLPNSEYVNFYLAHHLNSTHYATKLQLKRIFSHYNNNYSLIGIFPKKEYVVGDRYTNCNHSLCSP